jgi:serine/threonine-protein kinase
VYEATNDSGDSAVVKLIPKEPGAARELLFESLSGKPNVIPILDYGEVADHYVIVMPRADRSLRSYLEQTSPLSVEDATGILLDIATALASLESEVVHRDLKPDNILFWNGHWCLADFGISRYRAASTSQDTRKGSFTAAYAAPEQWRYESATSATDVYAFGVIAFELVSGHRPFQSGDLRNEHLTVTAPSVKNCPSAFTSLVADCLLKAPASRPSAKNLSTRLARINGPVTPAGSRLQDAHAQVAQKQAEEVAAASALQTRIQARAELGASARQTLSRILDDLRSRIQTDAPGCTVLGGGLLHLQLGQASISVSNIQTQPEAVLSLRGYTGGFDVIATAEIRVRMPRNEYDYDGGAHSLWYCDAETAGAYRWYELGFSDHVFSRSRSVTNPYALPPNNRDAQVALSSTMSIVDLFWAPLGFDQGDEEQFLERWTDWFAAACTGTLELWQYHQDRNKNKQSYRRFR